MNARLRWRKFVSGFMLTMTGICAIVAVAVLFFILGYLVYHGGTSISWNFFTKLPAPVGESGGGMANAIVGSAKLLLLAALIGVPIGFLGAIYLAEFSGSSVAFVVRYAADLLNGVPSIVIGIFAYSLAVLPFKHFSTIAGGLALGVMMIPITLRSTEEFLRAVPRALREGAMALGASKSKTIATSSSRPPTAASSPRFSWPSHASRAKPLPCSSLRSAAVSGVPAGTSQPPRSLL
jgi:phosphate transport system permease protein